MGFCVFRNLGDGYVTRLGSRCIVRHAKAGAAFVSEQVVPFGLLVCGEYRMNSRTDGLAGGIVVRIPSLIAQFLKARHFVVARLVETGGEGAYAGLVRRRHLRHREARARHRGGHQNSGETHDSNQFRQGNHSLNPSTPDGSTERARGKETAYGGAALAGNVAGVGGAAATAFVASQEMAGRMFEDAIENGASLEQAFRARDLGQMLGLIEAIPIVPLLNKLAPEARGRVMRSFVEAMKSGTEAGVEEAWKSLGGNLVASKLVAYDPERKVYEGVIDDAKVSFTAASIMQAIGAAIANR